MPSTEAIEFVSALLQSLLPDLDEEMQKKMSFLLEQLELLQKTPKQRRYTSFLLATAMMWQMTSPALYNQLLGEHIITLPCVRQLKRLSSALTVDGTLSDSTPSYLKMRLGNLGPRKRLICIIIDEVFSAKRIEFAGGKLYCNENDDVSKTLLCFMTKSVASNYRDMVAMLPIAKIDAGVIEKNFLAVVDALTHIGFEVVCVSTDGHSANIKFYEQLCDGSGKIQSSIKNPSFQGKRIFLLFDPVHLFKNFFTNFLNRTFFEAPSFKGNAITGNFNHVSQLYHKELGMSLKLAHKLTQKVILPRPIERSSVMLPERFFHESTVAALRFYSDAHWNTADLLDIFHNWWNVVNVRSTTIGLKKRDELKKPVTATNCDQIQYLEAFGAWLRQWKETAGKKTSLTRETLFCAIQTSQSLPLLAKYLLTKKEFNFVLLGKISSDPIEHRFGHYRQLAGANYFMSVHQFLEAEKAIRLKLLIKYSKLTMAESLQNLASMNNNSSGPSVQRDVDLLLTLLEEEPLEIEMSEDIEDAIIYFVSGYIARGILKTTKWQLCSQLVCESRDMPPVLFCDDANSEPGRKSAFLDQINRGGLVKPSDLVFIYYCIHAHELHHLLFATKDCKDAFLSSHLPRDVFAALLRQKMEGSHSTRQLLETKCAAGHDLEKAFTRIATTFCNCMLKNYVSELNDKLHEARKRAPKAQDSKTPDNRKIAKLQNK
jgi:hypothetical protein